MSDPFILRSSIETAMTSAFAWLLVSDSSVPQEREMQSLGSSVRGGEAGRDAGREGAAPRAGAAGCFGRGACARASWAEFLLREPAVPGLGVPWGHGQRAAPAWGAAVRGSTLLPACTTLPGWAGASRG